MAKKKLKQTLKIGNFEFRIIESLNGVRDQFEVEAKLKTLPAPIKINELADTFESEAGCWYAILHFLENS